MKCESCGMEMKHIADYTIKNADRRLCASCKEKEGSLQPREEVRNLIVNYWIWKDKIDRTKVEIKIDDPMERILPWSDNMN